MIIKTVAENNAVAIMIGTIVATIAADVREVRAVLWVP